MPHEQSEVRAGVVAGAVCYAIWGLVPLAFQAIQHTGPGPWEIVTHRVIWGTITAVVLVFAAGQKDQVLRILREPKTLGWLALSAALIAVNWLLFIWAVTSHRVMESSLGYYITPLINMAAGALVFRERIDRIGAAAIAVAAVGVIVQGLALGVFPWVSLALAVSFGGYGIVRKRVKADAQSGLLIECLFLLVPCLAYVGWLESRHLGHFTASPAATAWLVAAGPITIAPLALFAWAARKIPLSTMGFLQFLAPTISFVIGIMEGEAFNGLRLASFVFIWGGAAIYAWGAWRKTRRLRPALAASSAKEPLTAN